MMQTSEVPHLFKWNQVLIGLFYFAVFLMMFFLTIHQLKSGPSDVGSHIFFVEKVFNGEVYIPHPLWHIGVHYMKYITLNEKCAAAMVTALFVVLWVYVVHAVYNFLTDQEQNSFSTLLFLLIVFVIGPAYLPTFSKFIMTGTGSPNVWHNTTLFAVKPFALLALFFTVLSLERHKISYYMISFISLFISIFAKPSFVIAFLPALALYILIKRIHTRENLIYFILLSLMSVGVLGYQFTHTYGSGNNGAVIVDFLGVWSRYSPNVLISITLAIIFPLIYSVLNMKSLKENNYMQLTWLMTFVAIGYAAVFAESGPRYNHGNFFWSYMISLSLLYVFVLADYFKHFIGMNKLSKIILNLVLIWQIAVGVYYFVRIMEGYDASGVFEMPKWF